MKCSKCRKEIAGEYYRVGNDVFHKGCLVCDYCKKELNSKWIESNGKKYHEKCYKENIQLKCKICGKVIDGEYTKDKDGEYHKSCYQEHFLPKCSVCSKPLSGKYIVDFWGNKSHTVHGITKQLVCSCCGRIISDKTSKGGNRLNDGRIICGICKGQAVQNTAYAKQEIEYVKELLKNVGINVPDIQEIALIDREKMKVKSTSKDALGFAYTETQKQGNKIVSISHKIYILHTLQKLVFLGVLAHEMIHLWINQNQIKLNSKDTEGICNLGSYLVYLNSSEEIAKYLIKNLDENEDPIYGDGYRKMKKELDKIGWSGIVKKIL